MFAKFGESKGIDRRVSRSATSLSRRVLRLSRTVLHSVMAIGDWFGLLVHIRRPTRDLNSATDFYPYLALSRFEHSGTDHISIRVLYHITFLSFGFS